MPTHRHVIAAVLALLACANQPAYADSETQSLEELRNTVINLLDALVKKGVMTREQAQAMVSDAQAKAEAAEKTRTQQETAEEKEAVRVPYVPQIVQDQISKQVESEIKPAVVQGVVEQAKAEKWGIPGAMPDWLSRVRAFGDITLRAQGDYFAQGNVPDYWFNYNAINSAGGFTKAGLAAYEDVTQDQERLRLRARFGLEGTLSSWLVGDIRISTGSPTNPVSQWQTLGNGGARYTIGLDQAFLRADFRNGQQFPWLTVVGGRMPDPFLAPTNLIYYQDLAFEGIASTYRLGIGDGSAAQSNVFATVGALPIEFVSVRPSQNQWLLGGQLGLNWRGPAQQRLILAAAYYDFLHVSGIRNSLTNPLGTTFYNFSTPPYIQFGNTYYDISDGADPTVNLFGLAAQFRLLNGALHYELPMGSHQLTANWDWVRNVGYNVNDVLQRSGILQSKRNMGSQEELAFGNPVVAELWHWRFLGGYRYLQRDAVMDGWTDSDFHLGGTNARGYYVAGELGLAPGTWVRIKYWASDVIDGPKYGEDTVQLDLNARF